MCLAEDQDTVEDFAARGAVEAFAGRVHARRLDGVRRIVVPIGRGQGSARLLTATPHPRHPRRKGPRPRDRPRAVGDRVGRRGLPCLASRTRPRPSARGSSSPKPLKAAGASTAPACGAGNFTALPRRPRGASCRHIITTISVPPSPTAPAPDMDQHLRAWPALAPPHHLFAAARLTCWPSMPAADSGGGKLSLARGNTARAGCRIPDVSTHPGRRRARHGQLARHEHGPGRRRRPRPRLSDLS